MRYAPTPWNDPPGYTLGHDHGEDVGREAGYRDGFADGGRGAQAGDHAALATGSERGGRGMNRDQRQAVLESHRKWLVTNGKIGAFRLHRGRRPHPRVAPGAKGGREESRWVIC